MAKGLRDEIGWIILRTSGSSTMPLARGLRDAGYDAWTPIEIQNRRRPRSKDRYDREWAVMPSYVFAREDRLVDLVKLSRQPAQCYRRWDAEQEKMVMHGIPYFSVFRYDDRFPVVDNSSLEPLRVIERRTAPKPKAAVFGSGDKVRLVEGSFAGMSGVVQSSKGDYAMVSFPNYPIAIKIARLLLLSDMILTDEPVGGIAAQAA